MNVTPIDWAILAAFFVAFLALAIYLNSRCRSVADYLVSGRKVRMWLGMGAGIAGEVGLVSIAASCQQGYLHGFGFVVIGILNMMILIPLFGIFGFGIERFRATKAMSVPQYVEMRYDKRLRLLTGFINSLAGVVQMSIFPVVGAHFVRVLINAPEHVTLGGLEMQSAWLIMGVLLACNVLFTYLGGYITLVVSNFFQMIVIIGALYAVLFRAIGEVGLQNCWSALELERGVSGVYPFAGGEHSYGFIWFAWLTIMGILLNFSYGPYLQKFASMDKPKTVSRSYLIGSVFGNGRTFVILGLGVVALAALGSAVPEGLDIPERVWDGIVTPYFLATVVPPVLMGLLLAGLLFADISTTDQYLISWSTSIVNDCVVPLKKKPFSQTGHITAVRLTIVVLCVLFFINGLFYEPTMPLWEYLWLCANIIGGTGIAVLAGMYWRRATTAGAYAAVLTSLVLPLADLVARRIHVVYHPGEPIAWKPEYTGFSTYVLAAVLLVVISLLFPGKTKYWDLGETVREMNVGRNQD